ncbi:hypothetical protein [Tabrizicola sp.]|uniref:hypothetical protein n=1 Tax=Tabrizicola sp. TaxID=2005166 RepID=UPI003D28E54B
MHALYSSLSTTIFLYVFYVYGQGNAVAPMDFAIAAIVSIGMVVVITLVARRLAG